MPVPASGEYVSKNGANSIHRPQRRKRHMAAWRRWNHGLRGPLLRSVDSFPLANCFHSFLISAAQAQPRLRPILAAQGRARTPTARVPPRRHRQDLAAQRATVQSLQAAVAQSEQRLAQLRSTYESDLHTARVVAVEKLTQLEQQSKKLSYRQSNLELKAPQAGIVKELATTTVGAA